MYYSQEVCKAQQSQALQGLMDTVSDSYLFRLQYLPEI